MAATEIHCDYTAEDGDTTGDGTIGNPYRRFQKAHDVIRARGIGVPGQGADTTVWLRGTADYEEGIRVEEETTGSNALPLVIEGYTDTPGDGGMATFNGAVGPNQKAFQLENAVSDNNVYNWVVKNIYFKNYTSVAFEGYSQTEFIDSVIFQHCRFGNNAIAVKGAAHYSFLDCWFHDNTTAVDGVWLDRGNFLRCIFENNTNGLEMTKPRSGAIWNSLFIGNVNYAISTNHGVPIVNCVIDGKNKVGQLGVRNPDVTDGIPKILNTIILDCVGAVSGVVAGMEELSAIFNCCFYLNTLDFLQGAAKRTGCIFVDPQFIDQANKDYGIKSTSPCKETGMDLELFDYYVNTASRVDIGLLQESRSASGGLHIGAPLGFSVER